MSQLSHTCLSFSAFLLFTQCHQDGRLRARILRVVGLTDEAMAGEVEQQQGVALLISVDTNALTNIGHGQNVY